MAVELNYDWEAEAEAEGDHLSFDDSDRFEEDSLCSWISGKWKLGFYQIETVEDGFQVNAILGRWIPGKYNLWQMDFRQMESL